MSENTQQPEPKRFQCRHILTNGLQCRAVCLRGDDFCYFHHTTRRPLAHPSERREATTRASARRATFTLPLIEDRASIQLAIAQILCRIAANEIDPRRAGLLLYGLQIASLNLPKLPLPESDPELTVEEVIQHPDHGPIAPQQDYSDRPRSGGKTLAEILREDWVFEPHHDRESAEEPAPFDLDSLHAVAEDPAPTRPPANALPRIQKRFPATISAINSAFFRPSSTPAFSVVRKYISLTRPSTLTRFPTPHNRASFPTPRILSLPAAHSFSASPETTISSVPVSAVNRHRPSSTRGGASIFTSVFAAPPSTFSAVPTVSHGQLTCAAPTRLKQSTPATTSHLKPSFPSEHQP